MEKVILIDAPFYVVSTDRFMSGWGHATRKINKCVVPCETMEQAESVKRYVESRSEQEDIQILDEKPAPEKDVLYSVVEGWLRRAAELDKDEERINAVLS